MSSPLVFIGNPHSMKEWIENHYKPYDHEVE